MEKLLISHVWNEEFLMPYWIRHHRELFPRAVLIDFGSTDRTLEIVRDLAPPGWKVVPTETVDGMFYAEQIDRQIMDIERAFQGWKICLNTTEFLLCADLDDVLIGYEREGAGRRGFWNRELCVADAPWEIGERVEPNVPLWAQRWHGEPSPGALRSRLMHNYPCGEYQAGRHQTNIPELDKGDPRNHDQRVFMLWFGNSPAAHIRPRRLQIQNKIPGMDRVRRLGYHHILTGLELDNQIRAASASAKNLFDSVPGYSEAFARAVAKWWGK